MAKRKKTDDTHGGGNMAKKSREDSNSPLAAAQRWRERTDQRTRQVQAAAERNYTNADSLDRLAKRVVRLKNWVAHRDGC